MSTFISSKFQIVIPKKLRESLKLRSGMKIELVPYENRIEIIPLRPLSSLFGSLKGMDTSIKRDEDRL